MAKALALSTPSHGEIEVRSEMRDFLRFLHVLHANEFEGESFDAEHLEQTEEAFYRGAPPKWLNFHISEQAKSGGTGTPLIKRDGYETLVQHIYQRKKAPGVSTVKLFHQPGCGGTTLAMQVLWDLRKTFRCAVLRDSTSDITNVAKDAVHLFTAGRRKSQNTVLLLLNNEQNLEDLQDSIMMRIAAEEKRPRMTVAILLCCVRKDEVLQSDHVFLQNLLSGPEEQSINEKKEELRKRFGDECQQFHGFNIMQTSFSEAYVQGACAVIRAIKRSNRRSLVAQLAAFLSLLNAYAPGSYLLESDCLDFLKKPEDSIHGNLSLEDRMEPFSHLIITFKQDETNERKVRMAHPLIAQCCTELMADAGITRSDTARNFLTCFCGDVVPPFLFGFIKDMLTKRKEKRKEANASTEFEEGPESFSRLILDIQKEEGSAMSASVLKVASNKFDQDPFFPQALARVYFRQLHHYNLAEMWAKRAKPRDPQNSFVADTLGQIHKHHLKKKMNKKCPATSREILQLAAKAIEAFEDAEKLADNEQDTDMKGDGNTKTSHIFNTSGHFGYLEVCNLVYDLLTRQNETWRKVLTQNVSLGSVLEILGDNKLLRFDDLIKSLRGEVERKCQFLDKYLTFSKPSMKKDNRQAHLKDVSDCRQNYVGDSVPTQFDGSVFIQKLKENLAEEITALWEENHLHQSDNSSTEFTREMFQSPGNTPELHMVTILRFWPTDGEDECVVDLTQLIQWMHHSYEREYRMYYRSRFLRPLFFIGKGQDENRVVPRDFFDEVFQKYGEKTENWSNEKVFEDHMVKERLVKVDGVVQNYRVYAIIGGKRVEVDANLKKNLWINREVSFYLGFTIRGPVAFYIRTKAAEKVPQVVDSPNLLKNKPQSSVSTGAITASGQHFVDRHQEHLINGVSDPGFILTKLEDKGLISSESSGAVRALRNTQDQMSGILQCLTTTSGKDAFYEILKSMRSMKPLIRDLEESE